MRVGQHKAKTRRAARRWSALGATILAAIAVASLGAACARAQETASLVIDDDCKVFAIAPDNTIVYAVPHLKRFEKIILERDEIWVSSPKGNKRRIVDPDKFMPTPPPSSYIVQSLSWSADSQKIAVSMQTKQYPWSPKVKGKKKGSLDDDYEDDNTEAAQKERETGVAASGGGQVVVLLDQNGQEIKVANSKTRFIEDATRGMWLADGKTVVYLTGSPYQVMRVTPDDGKSAALFGGRRFNTVAWDTQRNRAFAVGEGLGINSRLTLINLDLAHETISELAKLEAFNGSLAVSPNGTSVGYFKDGDTIEVRPVATPTKTQTVRAGVGRFEFDRDDRRILLKRGPEDRSNDLVWVRLDDGNFDPILHDLVYHDFHISPDGRSLGVTDPGKSILRMYPLE